MLRAMTEIDVKQGVRRVLQQIEAAKLRRSDELQGSDVTLVAVSKIKPVELIIEAYDEGQRHFGENYVQELFDKATDPLIQEKCRDIKWHFIGHLQSNKVNKLLAVPNLYLIETVDSKKRATQLNKNWPSFGATDSQLNVMIQVNTSGEDVKNGIEPSEVNSLAEHVKECQNLRALKPRSITKAKWFSSVATQEDEYTATPQYPPILDLSLEKKMERKRETKYEEIRKVKTVEEKQIKVNMPRYYGFKSYMLLEDEVPYDSLTLAQHVTRTHLIENRDLPEYYRNIREDDVSGISEDIQKALLMEIEGMQRIHDLRNDRLSDAQREDIISSSVVKSVNRVLNNHLARQFPHILDNKIDIDPRLESSWVVGGMEPDKKIKSSRRGKEFFKQFENDPIDRTFCYLGSPSLTIRAELPLPTIISPSDAENPALEVPFFKYDPRVMGMGIEHRFAANIPGFWPADNHTFGLISFLKTGHMLERKKFLSDEIDNREAMHRQAILSSYAWLYSQANYLGFTTFNDITYPLVTQTVLTNGKSFSFYIYQLNTIILHNENTSTNPKRNVCWASGNMNLYEDVNDGKIVGFNEEAVKTLLKLYKNEPRERLGVNLRPYLGHTEKLVADYEDEEKRKWLEKEYKFIVSNRPRFKEFDEVYNWEKIYKIDHKTGQMDRRHRFFELFQSPSRRTMDARMPKYVPKVLRPELPKNKGKSVKEFWP